MLKKAFSILLIAVLFLPYFGFALTGEPASPSAGTNPSGTGVNPNAGSQPASDSGSNPPSTGTNSNPAAGTDSEPNALPSQPTDSSIPSTTSSFSCRMGSLTPEENQKLLDLRKTVPYFDEMNSGTPPNKNRKTLENNKAVIPDATGELGLKQQFPNQEIDPSEVAWMLYKGGTGAFAVGLVLNDTLRLGKCDGTAKENCPVRDKGLQFKNDSYGIKEDMVNAAGVLKDIGVQTDKKSLPLDQKALDILAKEAELDNPNPKEGSEFNLANASIPAKTAKRLPGNALPNRIETQNFDAGFGTTCQNSSCIISVYSMFDKYFNSMFSADMVLSSIAPTLIGKAGYMLKSAKTRGFQFPFKGKIDGLAKKFQRTYFAKPSELRKSTVDRFDFIQRKYGFDAYNGELYTKGALIGDGTYADWEKKFWAESAQKINTYELRRKFVDQATNVYEYSKISKQMSNYTLAELKAGRITRAEAGQRFAAMARDWDDGATHFDLPQAFIKNERHGLTDVYVKRTDSGQVVKASHENISGNLVKDFGDDGVFGAYVEAGPTGGLQIFKINPTGKPISPNMTFDSFEAAVRSGQYQNQRVAVKLNTGAAVEPSIDNLDFIRTNTSGSITVYGAELQPAGEITADDFGGRLLDWVPSRIDAAERSMGRLTTTLREHQWASRNYYSWLDKAALEEENLIKNYFSSIKGAAKWTAMPFGYWYAKQGFTWDSASAYRLPSTWTEINFSPGTEAIYNDAYVDFFSNAGSDVGDIFVQLLNKMPWKGLVIDPIAEQTPWAGIFKKLTGEGARPNIEDLAFFLYGSKKKCSSCISGFTVGSLSPEGLPLDFYFKFTSKEQLQSFMFEDPVSEKAKKQGQSLIAFTHHTNLNGKSTSGEQGSNIDIAAAIRDKKTCTDAVKDSLYGMDIGPRGAAAVFGIGEIIGYAAFGMAGILGSAAQQLYIAEKFNGCIDEKEGYFVHYYAPPVEEAKGKASSSIAGAEKASDIVKQGQNAMENLLTGASQKVSEKTNLSKSEQAKEQGLTAEELQQKEGGQGVAKNLLSKIKEGTDNLVNKIQDNDIVQARFSTKGQSSGQTYSKKLFWFWFDKSDWNPLSYRTKGVTNFVDKNGNVLKSDYEKGQISLNGKVLVNEDGSRPEFQRVESLNLNVPAKEIPERLGFAKMPGGSTVLFEMLANGEMFVEDARILDCIKQAVLDQSGVALASNKLADAFGFATFIETEQARVTPNNNQIIVEGSLRIVAEGAGSKAVILGNRQVDVTSEAGLKSPAGLLQSIQFEHGLIMYNPQTQELIIWLKHHKMAIATTKDVTGIKPKLTTAKNPITGCDEPAIDLEMLAAETGASQEKVENLNAGLKKNGPFQVFETDKKIFTFYSGPPPECQPRFRVLDKETGEVYDQAIKPGTLKQTPTGVEFETADGKKHNLDFSAPEGKPVLTYNGEPQNLLSAQGKNGSFYFNPDTGEYFAENGQFIPLNEKFKQGISPTVKPDGTVAGVPGQNLFAQGSGTGGKDTGLLNLPSLPENLLLLLIFLTAISASILIVRIRKK